MWKLAEDTLDHEDMVALAEWVRGNPRLTQGPLVVEFETAWSQWLGVKHSVMMSSGSTANFALVLATERRLGHKPRVGVSAVTWSTNITPSIMLGHDIHVFDVDPTTLGVDAQQVIEAVREDRIDVLFVTHLLGFNALTDELLDALEASNVLLIEDVCESHGATFRGQKVGTFGLGGTFSFYYGHHMSTIEGGIVSTNDDQLADDLRLLRAHGLARESLLFDEHATEHPEIDRRFLFLTPGLNFRSSDLNAFLGLRQLETLDERIEIRNRNLYTFLENAPSWVQTSFRTEGVSSFALPILADSDKAAAAARRTVELAEIESRPVVAGNLLRQPFLSEYERMTAEATPNADAVHKRGIYVGNGHHVSTEQVLELTDRLRGTEV
jgi:CDP-6-deoxy-D-xylo-4-hexulose-3-dehydrase